MPRSALVLLASLAFVLPGAAMASTEHGRWRRPLPGAVVASFAFDATTPYARGRRRGIDVAARAGAPVLAACTGGVAYAGAVPRWGRGVTLRCGDLVATELGLASAVVRQGERVRRGALVGTLGGRGRLRLGARRAGEVHGYVDPELLLGADRPWAAPPSLVGRRPRWRPPALAVREAPRLAARVSGEPPRRAPWGVWLGLALVADGAGGSGVAIRWRHRGRRADAVGAHR